MSKTVLFGNAAAYTSAANPTLLAAGEIGVYSVAPTGAFTLITTTPSAAQKALPIMIAQGGVTGGNFKNVMIYPGGITSAPTSATAYLVPVPNIDIVGYTGAGSDTITAGVAGTYNLTVTNTSKTAPPLPFNMASSYYATSTAATSFQVAYDWAKSINAKTLNTSLQPYDRFVFASVLTSTTSTAIGGSETLTVTNGSTSVTSTGFSHGLVGGDYVRIGSATATTAPVYRVLSVSGSSITLDAPYVNSALAIGASISSVNAGELATLVPTSGGVRLVSYGNWFNGSAFKELYPNFSIAAGVNGTGPVGTPVVHNGVVAQSYLNAAGAVTSGVAAVGYGIGWQAQKQEFEAQAFQGNTNRSFLPYPVQYFASASSVYDGYAFNYRSFPTSGGANDGNYKSEIHECVIFCVNAGGSGTVATNALITARIPTIIAGYA